MKKVYCFSCKLNRYVLAQKRGYQAKNKDKISNQRRKHNKAKERSDPFFKLRHKVSSAIGRQLKRQGFSKKSSFLDALGKDYIKILKPYLEVLWAHPDNLTPEGKVWMSWENHGTYKPKTWIDDDYSTHICNMDHI